MLPDKHTTFPLQESLLEVTPMEQHIYHHSDKSGPTVSVKTEKNTKGYNWEASVSGASSVEEALDLLEKAEKGLRALYGERVSE